NLDLKLSLPPDLLVAEVTRLLRAQRDLTGEYPVKLKAAIGIGERRALLHPIELYQRLAHRLAGYGVDHGSGHRVFLAASRVGRQSRRRPDLEGIAGLGTDGQQKRACNEGERQRSGQAVSGASQARDRPKFNRLAEVHRGIPRAGIATAYAPDQHHSTIDTIERDRVAFPARVGPAAGDDPPLRVIFPSACRPAQ